ncbi:MAG: hypothetical protein KA146_12690 [Leptospiraceae bacterium]|nr:hypothetical protein [Leptospiraceae bacterium]
MAVSTKKRAETLVKKDSTGKLRQELYANAYRRIQKSIVDGYPLEGIALLDSIITDRIEAYLTKIYNRREMAFLTLDKALKILKEDKRTVALVLGSGSIPVKIHQGYIGIISDLENFRNARNQSLHEFMKVEEGKFKSWNDRLDDAKKAVQIGNALYKNVDSLFRKFTRHTLK